MTVISVNPEGLGDFARIIHEENQANLEPYAARIISDHSQGVLFGASSLSNEMHATRETYQECLTNSVADMHAYVLMSQFLVTAITEVAERYKDVDALSADRADRLAAELNYAWYQAEVKHQEAVDAAEAAERERELKAKMERLQRMGLE